MEYGYEYPRAEWVVGNENPKPEWIGRSYGSWVPYVEPYGYGLEYYPDWDETVRWMHYVGPRPRPRCPCFDRHCRGQVYWTSSSTDGTMSVFHSSCPYDGNDNDTC